MRILYLTGEYPPDADSGGIGSYVAAAAGALGDAGHEPHVLVVSSTQRDRDELVGPVHVHRRRTHRLARLAGGPSSGRIAGALSMWWHARSLGPVDVVEAPDWQAAGLAFALRGRPPLAVVLHTPDLLVRRESQDVTSPGAARMRLSDRLEAWTARRAGALSCPAPLLVDELHAAGWLRPGTEISSVPYPLDDSVFSSVGGEATEPLVLGVGRVERRKGFDLLVRAMALVREAVPEARLVIVGADQGPGGAEAARVTELAGALEVDLELAGVVAPAEVARWYERARVVAVPSRFDSGPMVAFEAMSMARPVVCSDRCGVAALADGSSGLVAVPRDPGAFAAALVPHLRDRSHAVRAGEAARRRVQDQCAPGRFVSARLDDYRRAGAG